MQFRRNAHKPRQVLLGNLDARELALPGVGITNGDRDVQAEIADEGERVRRIYGQRCEHREHGCLEITVCPVFLFARELFVVQQQDSLLGQVGFETPSVVILLLLEQRFKLAADLIELLPWREAIFTERPHTGMQL